MRIVQAGLLAHFVFQELDASPSRAGRGMPMLLPVLRRLAATPCMNLGTTPSSDRMCRAAMVISAVSMPKRAEHRAAAALVALVEVGHPAIDRLGIEILGPRQPAQPAGRAA